MRTFKNVQRTAAILVLGASCAGGAWAQNDWCKSKWGPNDEIGAANLLTTMGRNVRRHESCHLCS